MVTGEPPIGECVQEGHDLAVIFLLAHHYSGDTFVSWKDDDIIHGPKVFQGTPLNLGQVGFGKLASLGIPQTLSLRSLAKFLSSLQTLLSVVEAKSLSGMVDGAVVKLSPIAKTFVWMLESCLEVLLMSHGWVFLCTRRKVVKTHQLSTHTN